ncbi:MAG: cupin domain-containing protein [Candidatus Omnitrophica bacterium]|nr:cupin domain-containing protein [Candidatus Omnitrophota bacterium]
MEITVKKPTQEELDALDIKNWGIWECEKSTFEWTYSDKETCYIYEGKVTVKTDEGEVSFQSKDLVVFPKGLSCTWIVEEPVRKAYKFG